MGTSSAWLMAMRLRTLPLAIACIVLGTFLAAADGMVNGWVTALCVITAVFLQILSNLANDYGDSVHGADKGGRQGPQRAVQSGQITPQAMKQAMGVFALLSVGSGIILLWMAFGVQALVPFLLFVVLGGAAIGAAITYTAGSKPYGYAGLGDVAVLIFFGWVGVMGSYFLQTQQLDWLIMLPATSCGLLAVAVLNVNNIRDLESDRQAGKFSIPVRVGPQRARMYHWGLLGTAVFAALLYVLLTYQNPWQFLFLFSLPLLWRNGSTVANTYQPPALNPVLKQTVQLTLLFVVLLGLGQVLGSL